MVLLYCDASYYPVRGGASGTGFSCGLYITNMSIHDNFNGYFIGAALSFILHIILFAVVLLTLVPIVVYSLLLPIVVLLIPAGIMALL